MLFTLLVVPSIYLFVARRLAPAAVERESSDSHPALKEVLA
jgi:hypothetical protein